MQHSLFNDDPYFVRGDDHHINDWSFIKKTKSNFLYIGLTSFVVVGLVVYFTI